MDRRRFLAPLSSAVAASLARDAITALAVGGAITGDQPNNSVVNKYRQSWDVLNLFVVGASAFPQIPSFNPTAPVGALAYYQPMRSKPLI